MGVDTKFYFANRVQPVEIVNAIQKEFGVMVNLDSIKFEPKRYEGDFDRYYGYLRFTIDMICYSWHFYQFNHISGGIRDKTNPDTLSGYCCLANQEAMKRIGKYFGGWFVENDCDEQEVYVEKTENEVESTNYQKLERLICSEVDYAYSQKVMNFIQQHKDKIIEFDFGKIN